VQHFLVHISDVTELKISVLCHLPVLVYQNHDDNTQEDIVPPISSLYLESNCSRIESAPASKIIRLRWYSSAKNNRLISVERRTLEDEMCGELNDKFFITNECTYFSCMQFGTMFLMFSLALFNSGKIRGVLYPLINTSTLIYAVRLYYRPPELMRTRLTRPYGEMTGPTVICFAFIFAVG
jgi:hypothetical protein